MTKSNRFVLFTILGGAALFALLFVGRDWILRRGSEIACADGPRHTIDLRAFETEYSAYALKLEAKVSKRGSFSGQLNPVQVQQLSEAAQQAAEFRKWLVASYNACAVTSEAYTAAGVRFQTLDGLARRIDAIASQPSPSDADRVTLASLTTEYVRQSASLGEAR
ncbi:MAG TPA: hypothetical protein VN851_23895 [Thermoanaerobaculia bacterium]|nr:hypothetical protein [Thermoanaerobaculia bacterium]